LEEKQLATEEQKDQEDGEDGDEFGDNQIDGQTKEKFKFGSNFKKM